MFQNGSLLWSDGTPVNYLPIMNEDFHIHLVPTFLLPYERMPNEVLGKCFILIILRKDPFIMGVPCNKTIIKQFVCKLGAKSFSKPQPLYYKCPLNHYFVDDKCIEIIDLTSMDNHSVLPRDCKHLSCGEHSLKDYDRILCALMKSSYSALYDFGKGNYSKCLVYILTQRKSIVQDEGILYKTTAEVLTSCGPGQYQCQDGSCILQINVCDSTTHSLSLL